jgi:5-hydroxyisourate hydrolase-like protein (transthyretin family)
MSILVFVAKPLCINQWRFIVDLRHINIFYVRKRLRIESPLVVRHITRKGVYMLSFNLNNGFYAMEIIPEESNFVIVNVRGQLYRLAGLPIG